MTPIDNQFEHLLSVTKVDDLNNRTHVTYGLWPDYTLAFLGQGWFEFAKANDSYREITSQWGLGKSVLDATPPQLRPFYKNLYDRCIEDYELMKLPIQLDFECSSPLVYRSFRMTVYPLQGQGVLIVNNLLRQCDHSEIGTISHEASISNYSQPDGMIYQCCVCRKIRHARNWSRWDWVPEWVEEIPANTSHVVCGMCVQFYFESLGIEIS